jgi:hypothetical protein
MALNTDLQHKFLRILRSSTSTLPFRTARNDPMAGWDRSCIRELISIHPSDVILIDSTLTNTVAECEKYFMCIQNQWTLHVKVFFFRMQFGHTGDWHLYCIICEFFDVALKHGFYFKEMKLIFNCVEAQYRGKCLDLKKQWDGNVAGM